MTATCQPAEPAEVARELDGARLKAAAIAATGLEDFGDPSFEEPFARWLAAIPEEGHLHRPGVAAVQANTIRILSNRLQLQADLAAHPEIDAQPLAPPIIISGLPRTGTTKLQRTLSKDPGSQPLSMWRLMFPAPLPGWTRGQLDARIPLAEAGLAAMVDAAPDFLSAHPTSALAADEDTFLYELTFEGMLGEYRVRVPTYKAWMKDHSQESAYAYLRTLLKYLQWQDPDGRQGPFIMKSPGHLGYLDVLAKTFPGATFVHCHRDPAVVVPSFCRLLEVFRRMASGDVDLEEVGEEILGDWSRAAANNLLQRDRVADALNIVDVRYEDILQDATRVMHEVYSAHGLTLSPAVERTLMAADTTDVAHTPGAHQYSLERYGFTAERIRTAFGAYVDHFADSL